MKLFEVYRIDHPVKCMEAICHKDGRIIKTRFGSANGVAYVDHRDKAKRNAYLARHGALNENCNVVHIDFLY